MRKFDDDSLILNVGKEKNLMICLEKVWQPGVFFRAMRIIVQHKMTLNTCIIRIYVCIL